VTQPSHKHVTKQNLPNPTATNTFKYRGGGTVDLKAVLDTFEQAWSPRIVAYLNDYDIRLARFAGEHIWHVHNDTDEFFLVLEGTVHIGLREVGGERTVTLHQNQAFVVPKGVFHKPSSPGGAVVLLVEPTGTLSVGDEHDEVPAHVDATTGHPVT
jgi:mannose-6-phosphate isomerase-like protein (cupin superfamily)